MIKRMEKVVVSPDGDNWKIEILDEDGNSCHIHFEEELDNAMDYGYRQGTLYQLTVDIQID